MYLVVYLLFASCFAVLNAQNLPSEMVDKTAFEQDKSTKRASPGDGAPDFFRNGLRNPLRNSPGLFATSAVSFRSDEGDEQDANQAPASATSSLRRFRFGVRGGVPLNDGLVDPEDCPQCGRQRTLPYTVGPSAEIQLSGSFSISVDALYSHLTNTTSFGRGPAAPPPILSLILTNEKRALDRWEFPVLLKYGRPWRARLSPYVAGGMAIQWNRDRPIVRTVETRTGFTFAPQITFTQTHGGPTQSSVAVGPSVETGIELRTPRVQPSVAFRYTRWIQNEPKITGAFDTLTSTPLISGNQNQFQITLRLLF